MSAEYIGVNVCLLKIIICPPMTLSGCAMVGWRTWLTRASNNSSSVVVCETDQGSTIWTVAWISPKGPVNAATNSDIKARYLPPRKALTVLMGQTKLHQRSTSPTVPACVRRPPWTVFNRQHLDRAPHQIIAPSAHLHTDCPLLGRVTHHAESTAQRGANSFKLSQSTHGRRCSTQLGWKHCSTVLGRETGSTTNGQMVFQKKPPRPENGILQM